jgi:hypothetical protein
MNILLQSTIDENNRTHRPRAQQGPRIRILIPTVNSPFLTSRNVATSVRASSVQSADTAYLGQWRIFLRWTPNIPNCTLFTVMEPEQILKMKVDAGLVSRPRLVWLAVLVAVTDILAFIVDTIVFSHYKAFEWVRSLESTFAIFY